MGRRGGAAVLFAVGLGACAVDEPPPSPSPIQGCSGGGVIDQAPSTSTAETITLTGTVNLGNCDGSADVASVVVVNLTTSMAGSGHTSAPYCAGFFREYDVYATATLGVGRNLVEVRVDAGAWRACETVEVSYSP